MVELNDSKPLDYVRYVFSFLLLAFSLIVTSYAIFEVDTGFWKTIPGAAAFVLFLFDLVVLGIVEGLQISLVELKRQHPDSYKHSHKRAYKLGQIANRKDNVERFLMGRQVLVVFLVFFIAKLTTIELDDLENGLFFPVPHWLYVSLLQTGFLTCILVVIVAQLMPQIVAAKYPVHFLNFRVMPIAYYLCTFVEATGLTHACWVLSYLMGKIAGMTNEDVMFQKIDPSLTKSSASVTGKSTPGSISNTQNVSRKVHNKVTTETTLTEVEDLLDQRKQFSSSNLFETTTLDKLNFLVKTLDTEIDENKQAILRYYLDSHPERFRNFPSVIGNKAYPPPQEVAEHFQALGSDIPSFLRDISDPSHVPPHIVCCDLLVYVTELEKKIESLGRQQDNDCHNVTI
ncbi:unnamed protein product [Clavelina lepadiformis]|uniref:RGS domain-containing protein n=1 Tax=Clavelina lepadiformis TaxID=159417 RepID=A0ABP0FU69_CLALP